MQFSARHVLLVIAIGLFFLAGLRIGPEIGLDLMALGLACLAVSFYLERLTPAR